LGESRILEDVGPGGIFSTVPANVSGVIEHAEEGEEAGEGGMA
jgi:hypothetical protein